MSIPNGFSKVAVAWSLVAMTAGGIIFPTQNAQAIVGVNTGNPVLAAVGAATFGYGVFNLKVEGRYRIDSLLEGWYEFMAGLAMLDGEKGRSLVFQPMTAENAKKVGLTESELAHYNNEVDDINLIRQEIETQIASLESEPALQKSRELWLEMKGSLTPEAFSAVQKISTASLEALKK